MATLIGGLGGGTQHPVASTMVAQAFERRGSYAAIGTLNFAGDLGKMAGPALAAVPAVSLGWRPTLMMVGGAGIAFMGLSLLAKRNMTEARPAPVYTTEAVSESSSGPSSGFLTLSALGMLDGATRGTALTFLPFVLVDKGLGLEQVSALFMLLFAGGAAGKLACGYLGDRVGALGLIWSTKAVTALLLVAIPFLSPVSLAPLMVVFGFGLNGTSSVLYGTVARLAPANGRARRYGLYYTATEGSTAAAPIIYGLVADGFGLPIAMFAMAAATAVIVPVSLLLRRSL